ncbi:hypothetical protein [Dehalobacter sp. 4CP]
MKKPSWIHSVNLTYMKNGLVQGLGFCRGFAVDNDISRIIPVQLQYNV